MSVSLVTSLPALVKLNPSDAVCFSVDTSTPFLIQCSSWEVTLSFVLGSNVNFSMSEGRFDVFSPLGWASRAMSPRPTPVEACWKLFGTMLDSSLVNLDLAILWEVHLCYGQIWIVH